jgi:type VI secretion system protein
MIPLRETAPGRGRSAAFARESAMALRLRVTSQQKNQLGEFQLREFVACGGTIGRAPDNDWVLPDEKRFLSARHALIDFQAGAYYLVDMSRNGVYINGSDTAVGRGHPQRLFDGDKLRLGEYEITVEVTAGDEHIADDGMRDSVVRAQLVPVDESVELKLVEESKLRAFEYNALEKLTSADTESSSASRKAPPATAARAQAAKTAAPASAAAPKGASPRAAAPAARPAVASTATARAEPAARPAQPRQANAAAVERFCKAAGLQPSDLRGTNPDEVLETAGALTRELLTGLADLLQNRSRMKDSLRLPQTIIRPAQNNPLKFSANVSDALKYLLGEPGQSYLPPDRAVQAAFQDVKNHQQAFFKAMIHAIRDFVERLEPDELRSRFDRGLKRSPLFASANKLKYWELYEEAYLTLTYQQDGAPMPQIVIDELTRVYEQEIETLTSGATRPIAERPARAS